MYEVPQAAQLARASRSSTSSRSRNEKINAVLPIKEFDEDHFVFMATSDARSRRALTATQRPAQAGYHRGGPGRRPLVGVALTDGQCDVMLFSDAGKAVRFAEDDVRLMGTRRPRAA